MQIKCMHGKYVHPNFELYRGDISPELSQSEAERIMNDFPDQFEVVYKTTSPSQEVIENKSFPEYEDRMIRSENIKTKRR